MTEQQMDILKAIYLNKKRRDKVADEMGLTRKQRKIAEREAIRQLLQEYLEMKGL